MTETFDTVEEYWGRSDVITALDNALHSQIDPIKEFEKTFTHFVGALDSAFLVSGSETVYRALQILNVGKRDEVILPTFVFSVVAEAVLLANEVPVLVDIILPDGNINLVLVLKALSHKTRAVLIPHLYGIPLDFHGIKEKLEDRGVAIIEDCSHCLGGKIGEKVAGSLGTFSIFSFNYDKPISLGNGGMLVCSDFRWLGSFRRWKSKQSPTFSTNIQEEFVSIGKFLDSLTLRRSQIQQTPLPRKPPFLKRKLKKCLLLYCGGRLLYAKLAELFPAKTITHSQTFCKVGAVRAFLGLFLLQQYPGIASRRNQNVEYLLKKIQDRGWGETSRLSPNVQPMYLRLNVFTSQYTKWEVDYVAAKLCQAGFRSGRFNWTLSLDQIPYLSTRVRKGSTLLNAQNMAEHCLNLPIHQNMSKEDIDRMINLLFSIKIPNKQKIKLTNR